MNQVIENLAVGDSVTLFLPENPRMDRRVAVVNQLTDWGAHVTTNVGSGEFRATFDEMRKVLQPVAQSYVGGAGKMQTKGEVLAKSKGYTGDACDMCGSFRIRRNGSCLLCDDCGTTSGCS